MIDVKAEICGYLEEAGRGGTRELIAHMEQIGFFETPASTGYHAAKSGGLAEHSLNVLKQAMLINDALCYPCSHESIVICSLLHDLGKCGQFGKAEYVKNILKSGKQSESKPFERNKELLPTDHEVRSVIIASKYIELTEEEQYAILMHNGLYGPFKYEIQGNETPLYMILHFADMWASRVIERGVKDETV